MHRQRVGMRQISELLRWAVGKRDYLFDFKTGEDAVMRLAAMIPVSE